MASLSASNASPVLTARASMSLRLACPWCPRHVTNKVHRLSCTNIVHITMAELRDIRGSLWTHCEMTKCFSGPPREMMHQILLVVPTAWSPTKYELRLVMPPPEQLAAGAAEAYDSVAMAEAAESGTGAASCHAQAEDLVQAEARGRIRDRSRSALRRRRRRLLTLPASAAPAEEVRHAEMQHLMSELLQEARTISSLLANAPGLQPHAPRAHLQPPTRQVPKLRRRRRCDCDSRDRTPGSGSRDPFLIEEDA